MCLGLAHSITKVLQSLQIIVLALLYNVLIFVFVVQMINL